MNPRFLFPGILVALLAACGGGKDEPRWDGPPVVVLGVDGLDWAVLEPLMRDGRAPNFLRLAERGIAGIVHTDVPTYSPMLWTSIATGAAPLDHEILFFTEFDLEAMKAKPGGLPYTSNSRAVPAIWNICGDKNRSVLSVGWWVSWPAEVVPGGRIVASYAAQAQASVLWKAGVWSGGLDELTFPPNLQDDITPLLKAGAPDGPLGSEFLADFEAVPDRPTWKFEQTIERNLRFTYHGDRTHQRIFLEQLEREVADLNLLYLGIADVAGHFYWRYHEPESYDYQTPRNKLDHLKGRVEGAYEVVDRWVGEVLDELPEEAYVLVVSDHGMHAVRPNEQQHLSSGGHEDGPPGVLFASGPGIPARGLPAGDPEAFANIYDLFPTLLLWLDLPVPEDAAGTVRRNWMDPTWNAAHPGSAIATYANGFRAATPPRQPKGNANEQFIDGMKALGYF